MISKFTQERCLLCVKGGGPAMPVEGLFINKRYFNIFFGLATTPQSPDGASCLIFDSVGDKRLPPASIAPYTGAPFARSLI